MAKEALTDDKWPHKPSDYEWKGTLNQSGETWTVLAYCKAKGTDVIVKIKGIPQDNQGMLGDTDKEFNKLIDLVRSFQRLKSEFLLTPVHSFIDKKDLWLVMPRMSGGRLSETLNSHYRTGIPDETIVSRILLDIINGLAFMHENKVAHRNVRATSLHYCKDNGKTLLTEFAFLKETESGSNKPNRQTILQWGRGDPYVAPECYAEFRKLLNKKGDKSDKNNGNNGDDSKNQDTNKKVNLFAVDIYAIGVTALTLAFGEPPKIPKDVTCASFECYDRKSPFSKKFNELVNKCCNEDESKRPKAQDLLNFGLFKKPSSHAQVAQKLAAMVKGTEDRINDKFRPPPSMRPEEVQKGVPIDLGRQDSDFDLSADLNSTQLNKIQIQEQQKKMMREKLKNSSTPIVEEDNMNANGTLHNSNSNNNNNNNNNNSNNNSNNNNNNPSNNNSPTGSVPNGATPHGTNATNTEDLALGNLPSNASEPEPSDFNYRANASNTKPKRNRQNSTSTDATATTSQGGHHRTDSQTSDQQKYNSRSASDSMHEKYVLNVTNDDINTTQPSPLYTSQLTSQQSASVMSTYSPQSNVSKMTYDPTTPSRNDLATKKGRFQVSDLPLGGRISQSLSHPPDSPSPNMEESVSKSYQSETDDEQAPTKQGRFIITDDHDDRNESKQSNNQGGGANEKNDPTLAAIAKLPPNPSKWSKEEVGVWLESLGAVYEEYVKGFKDTGVDGELLELVDDEGLKDVPVNKGLHRLKIIKARDKLFGKTKESMTVNVGNQNGQAQGQVQGQVQVQQAQQQQQNINNINNLNNMNNMNNINNNMNNNINNNINNINNINNVNQNNHPNGNGNLNRNINMNGNVNNNGNIMNGNGINGNQMHQQGQQQGYMMPQQMQQMQGQMQQPQQPQQQQQHQGQARMQIGQMQQMQPAMSHPQMGGQQRQQPMQSQMQQQRSHPS